jgi:hypothetical protein
VTTPGTTPEPDTAAEETAVGVALAEALEAVAALHADALAAVARLAETWDAPADDRRVLRMAGPPILAPRAGAAAA